MEDRLRTIIAFLIGLKLLFIYCYHSTDFEVHRNWLSLTHSLPFEKWYFENTSIWTLDYPPFFAWFEFSLAQIGSKLDKKMVEISATPYVSFSTIAFQRISVIVTDIIYVSASLKISKLIIEQISSTSIVENRRRPLRFVLATLLICNCGLLLVDAVHFQYNGMLFGILLYSISFMYEGKYLLSALFFSILLNFKHIFAYVAPAYVVFLLKNYCFRSKIINFTHCFRLAAVLTATFGLSFGPFLYGGEQIFQLVQRLFPFKRGLTHAYWAPNFWALYNFVDLVLNNFLKKFFKISSLPVPEYTTGMVQEFRHTVLPDVTPLICLVLTLSSIVPFCLIALKTSGRVESFVKLLTLCAFSSYIFGWHVHEKAILMILIPLILLVHKFAYAKPFVLLAVVGHFSLLPLLFTEFESPLKYSLIFLYSSFAFFALKYIFRTPNRFRNLPFLNTFETLYVLGFVPLEIYCSTIHFVLQIDQRFKFLPLMLTSVYCSLGVLYVWFLCCWLFLCDETSLDIFLYRKIWQRKQIYLRSLLIRKNMEDWQKTLGNRNGPNSHEKLKFIAGLDISTMVGDDHNAVVCLAVLNYPSLELVHVEIEQVSIEIPYVAGFLAFREAPSLVQMVRKMIKNHTEIAPQVLFIDGNGFLHPRNFGLACHVGVMLDMPTIGVAKNFHYFDGLSNSYKENLKTFSENFDKDILPIMNEKNDEILGYAVRSNKQCKNPVFVSIGNKIDIDTAVDVVKKCFKHRVPEPIRQADIISRKLVQELLAS